MAISTKRKKTTRKFVVDARGRRTAVLISLKEYEELIEAAEQRDDIRHLEDSKKVSGDPVPWEQVKADLRASGKLR